MSAAQKKAQNKFREAVKLAKKIRSSNPGLSHPEAVKKAFAQLAGPAKPVTKKAAKRVTKKAAKPAVKKAAKPAAKKGCTTDHRDSKSHNVNIRVVSGIPAVNLEIEERNRYERKLIMANQQIQLLKMKKNLSSDEKAELKQLTKYISKLKKHLAIQNQFLKSL